MSRLDFHAVDELAYALDRGKLHKLAGTPYDAQELGPSLELMHLLSDTREHSWADWVSGDSKLSPLLAAIERGQGYWLTSGHEPMGYVRAPLSREEEPIDLNRLLQAAQRAAITVSGLSQKVAGQLVAAMDELSTNVLEHSEAVETGYVAYHASDTSFSFVSNDHGIGVLASLQKCSEFIDLSDSGSAMRAALTPGVSRHGSNSGHGFGFRELMRGLANLRGTLRFRSEDHALTMNGAEVGELPARVRQKPHLGGFCVSVKCHPP